MVAQCKAVIVVVTLIISVGRELKSAISQLPAIILDVVIRSLSLFVDKFQKISGFVVSIFSRKGYFVFRKDTKGCLCREMELIMACFWARIVGFSEFFLIIDTSSEGYIPYLFVDRNACSTEDIVLLVYPRSRTAYSKVMRIRHKSIRLYFFFGECPSLVFLIDTL